MILSFFILSSYFSSMSTEALNIKVGLMFPRNASTAIKSKIGYETSASAVLIAMDRIKQEGLLKNVTVSFTWRFSNCDESLSAAYSHDFIQENADVIIGPPCDKPAIITGVIANYFNLPMLIWAANNYELGNKLRFPSLIRTIGSARRMARSIKELLVYFGWYRVALLYTDDNEERECYSLAVGLNNYLPKANIISVYSMTVVRKEPTIAEMQRFLKGLHQFARICIVCLDAGLRQFMLQAKKFNVIGDDYVFIVPEYIRSEEEVEPWSNEHRSLHDDHVSVETARKAFRPVMFVEMLLSSGEELHFFKKKIPERMKDYPFYYDKPKDDENMGSLYSPFLHDAMYLYALALSKTLTQGIDYRNGTALVENAKNLKFEGMSGTVAMDNFAGREPVFGLRGFDAQERVRQFAKIELFKEDGKTVKLQVPESMIWSARRGYRPRGSPKCGWYGELCQDESGTNFAGHYIILLAFCGICVIIFVLVALVFYIKRQVVINEMAQMLWRVPYADVVPLRRMHSRHQASFQTVSTIISEDMQEAMLRGYENTAHYKGMIVWMKKHHGNMVFSTKQDHLHMKMLRDVSHENLNYFVGLCLDSRVPVSLWLYCSKGSLEDVLANDSIKLDWFFKFSFIKDLTNAVEALHESGLVAHGNLKSSNCLIDNRWMLKVTDYGLPMLRGKVTESKKKLWMAPEVLRAARPPPEGIQAADVYAYGIICAEVVSRDKPFASYTELKVEEIVAKVRRGEEPPFRPDMSAFEKNKDVDIKIIRLMQDCWDEDATVRPAFRDIRSVMKVCGKGMSTNLMDHALKMMETYAKNLESQVSDQTRQLFEESQKSDQLLYRMLPKSVVEKLKTGASVDPESYESVTVFFSDVHGFAELTSRSQPMQIVTLLNELYTLLDEIISKYDVYKVETINDSYMVASGLPHRNGNQHAAQIADMALHFQLSIGGFYVPHMPQERLQLRIGIHTGSVVAGVVGLTMPRFCLFGDTVNVSSRIETNGRPSCIHISDETFRFLTEVIGGYLTKPRGEIIVKGKGVMYTHWLLGKTTKKISDETEGQEEYSDQDQDAAD